MLTTASFFDISEYDHQEVFHPSVHVWDALKNLKAYMNGFTYAAVHDSLPKNQPLPHSLIFFKGDILQATADFHLDLGDATKGKMQVFRRQELLEGASVLMAGVILDGGPLSLGKGVLVESGAYLKSPVILGDYTEVRQGAYLRGYCLTGKRCVVGHVTEVKHAIFLDDAKAGHFAYLGDSILGNQVNLGAGTKLANLRFTGGEVGVRTEKGHVATGLRKFGAILGDQVQTGCNSVTNPGTLLGKKSMLLPNTTAPSGYHANSSLVKG
jgi:bifunctional N-acetylglucosamine-1-phosphate-uridyltransferase/glucosamine-1-phosphate-acetyltransferase GlmU-like protein